MVLRRGRHGLRAGRHDYREDFPCVVSPWPAAWFEFPAPQWSNNDGQLVKLPTLPGLRYGFFVQVQEVREEELGLPAGDGWTVAAILAHLAFWDYRVLVLLGRWKKAGIGPSPIDIDGVNEAMKPLCLALPGREAAALALRAAEAVDAEIEGLAEDVRPGLHALVQEGKLRLDRSIHRHGHLDQIERVLAGFREALPGA